MLLKKSISILSLVAGSIILISSCKKNDETSSTPALTNNQPAITTPANTGGSSFTIISNDGHMIGINGAKPSGNPKSGQIQAEGCGAATNLIIAPASGIYLSNGALGCVLSNNYIVGGGQAIALYINGQVYKDPSTGYGLWNPAINCILAECRAISGGINAGQSFKDFVRTYCNADTTGSPYYDSPTATCVVPSTFNSTCGSSGGTTTTTTKGHRK